VAAIGNCRQSSRPDREGIKGTQDVTARRGLKPRRLSFHRRASGIILLN
jgi:hypothetical protein